MVRTFLVLALALCASIAAAADVAVILDDSRPGTFLVTVGADGGITAVPLKVVRVGQSPIPPTNPPPSSETPLQATVRQLTAQAMAAGGKPDTAAQLAAVYAIVSDECLAGKVTPEQAWPLLTQATDAVLNRAADKGAWTAWRAGVGAELTTLRDSGKLDSKDQAAAKLREISAAIKGHLSKQVQAGILDEINWESIIALVRLIIELLQAFKK